MYVTDYTVSCQIWDWNAIMADKEIGSVQLALDEVCVCVCVCVCVYERMWSCVGEGDCKRAQRAKASVHPLDQILSDTHFAAALAVVSRTPASQILLMDTSCPHRFDWTSRGKVARCGST